MQQPARHMTPVAAFHDQPWSDRALCAQTDPEAFFPEKGGSTREAKQVCNGNPDKQIPPCPVRSECLDWALAHEERFGIFGGTSERERRKLKKEQQPVDVVLAATGTDHTTAEQPALVQYGGTYVAGGTHRPIPLATDIGVRRAHQPKTPRVTGLDWSKHTAPEPEQPTTSTERPVEWPCRWCRTPSAELVDDMCPSCRDDAEKAFHAPDPTALGQELADLEQTDPAVAAAAASYDDMVTRVTRPEDHIQAPREETPAPFEGVVAAAGPQETTPTPRLDVVGHCAQLLRDTATSPDPLIQMLRGSALSVLAALDHAYDPPTPAGPVAAAPDSTPAAATGTTPRRTPKTRRAPRRTRSTVDLAKATELLEHGHTCPEIAAELGVGVKAVRHALDQAGIPRPDGRALRSGGKPKNPTDDDPQMVADVRRLYLDQGLTQAEVAEQLGTSTKTIQNLMLRHEIPARPPAHKIATARPSKLTDPRTIDELCARYQAGESGNALAKAYGVSLPTILDRLRGRGVPIRSRGGHHPTTHPSGATTA